MNTPVEDLAPSQASPPLKGGARRALRSAADLAEAGLVSAARAAALGAVEGRYAIALTPQVAGMIDASDPADPIARQFVPDLAELAALPQESADPIGDDAHSPVEGLVHRYPDRVLIKLLHACAVYCRFCFRRESVGPGGASALSPQAFARAIDYIAARPQIWEVILTGGDPLTMSPRRMGDVMRAIGAIGHVKIVRIHTRVPALDPARIDDDMIAALKSGGKSVYVALHANHAARTERRRARRLREDRRRRPADGQPDRPPEGRQRRPGVLADLMRTFVENRIKPYYLHHPDLAPGTSHLRVSLDRGREIVAALRGNLSGLCQPEYVLDIPGGHGKVAGRRSVHRGRGRGRVAGDRFQRPDARVLRPAARAVSAASAPAPARL